MAELTIVVPCTDRKAAAPREVLQVRNLPPCGLPTRAAVWRSHLRGSSPTHVLCDLYRGESWSVVPTLLEAAHRAGFVSRLLVASAGLGLQRINAPAPSYSATFATGQSDSVGSSASEVRRWWHLLRRAPHALDPDVELRGSVLLVLSQAYAVALHEDLLRLGARGDDVLLFGGAVDVPGITRIAADRALRGALGGTATGLTIRMAREWMARLEHGRLTSSARLGDWSRWVQHVRREESWSREPLDDEQVLAFIRAALAEEPSLSRTRALRRLRDSGRACEQGRFAALYSKAVDTP